MYQDVCLDCGFKGCAPFVGERCSTCYAVHLERERQGPAHLPADTQLRPPPLPTITMGEYQERALVCCLMCSTPTETTLVLTLGLAGEAGEVADIIKKSVRDRKPVDLAHLTEELGDVLFYLATVADRYGINLEDVADFNLSKIQERYGKQK